MEEIKYYSQARQTVIETPDDIMTLIIDGMDHSTTIVPKFKQTVKTLTLNL